MMKKTPQLSFTVFTIFIILVLGTMANAKEKGKLCDQIQLPVNKDGLCVDSECQNKCREAKGPKGLSKCFGSKAKKSMNCYCGILC
ncbi:defensin-like protein 147 [Brassica napus]|nr:defensin-like protein 147 [Brassica napus]